MIDTAMQRKTARRRGFSLIELLVTIVVLAILVALTLAGVQRARTSAMNAKCVANLRQIGVGAMNYLHDRNGKLFPSKVYYSASFEPDGGLRDYVGLDFAEKTSKQPAAYKVDTVFTCPKLKELKRDKFTPAQLFNRCYTMNEYAVASENGASKDGSAYPLQMSRIVSLANMMLLTDGSMVASGSSFHTVMNPSYITRDFLFYPHGGAQNVLFFDGHVAGVSEADIRKPASPRKFWGNLELPE